MNFCLFVAWNVHISDFTLEKIRAGLKKDKSKERNLIFTISSIKQHHKDKLYQREKLIRHNKISSVFHAKKEETINHIVRECSNLTQKEFKSKHNCVRKVIHWELCKKLKFDHTTIWYMHKPESVLENETQNSLEFWSKIVIT